MTIRRSTRTSTGKAKLAGFALIPLLAGVVAAGPGASSASAQTCSPFPTCTGGAGYFQASSPDSQLWETTNPINGTWLGTIPNGYSLYVLCQADNGPQEDGKTIYGQPFTTWDYAWDSSLERYVYVYDYYMTTPVVGTDGYSWSNPALHCNF